MEKLTKVQVIYCAEANGQKSWVNVRRIFLMPTLIVITPNWDYPIINSDYTHH